VWQDILFWTILGSVVVANSLWEMKHGRDRRLGKASWTWRSLSTLTLKIVATFSFICILWSFWMSESIAEWLALWRTVAAKIVADAGRYPVLLGAALLALGTTGSGSNPRQPNDSMVLTVAANVLVMAALLAVSIERVYIHYGPTVASFIQPLRSGQLSRLDTAALERGYYENLMRVERFNSQLSEVYSKRPQNWLDTQGGHLKRHNDGFAQGDLIPSFVATFDFGTMSTNRWGMRDQDYELKPAPGTFRAAVLGASSVMGWGVGDGETFEALVEARLNREQAGAPFSRYEFLNFGIPGYQPPQVLVALEKALDFNPAAVLYVATAREPSRASWYLVEVVQKRIEIPYPELKKIVAAAGLEPSMDEATALRRLEPFRTEVLSAVYRRIVETSRARGIVPVWVFQPQVREGAWQAETPEMLRLAEEAGFVIVSLADVYKGEDVAAIRLAEWDEHPNARAHRLMADRLYELLQAKRDLVLRSAAR
jgi:hypothetical protein